MYLNVQKDDLLLEPAPLMSGWGWQPSLGGIRGVNTRPAEDAGGGEPHRAGAGRPRLPAL
jgi:hypothetical protein